MIELFNPEEYHFILAQVKRFRRWPNKQQNKASANIGKEK